MTKNAKCLIKFKKKKVKFWRQSNALGISLCAIKEQEAQVSNQTLLQKFTFNTNDKMSQDKFTHRL